MVSDATRALVMTVALESFDRSMVDEPTTTMSLELVLGESVPDTTTGVEVTICEVTLEPAESVVTMSDVTGTSDVVGSADDVSSVGVGEETDGVDSVGPESDEVGVSMEVGVSLEVVGTSVEDIWEVEVVGAVPTIWRLGMMPSEMVSALIWAKPKKRESMTTEVEEEEEKVDIASRMDRQ